MGQHGVMQSFICGCIFHDILLIFSIWFKIWEDILVSISKDTHFFFFFFPLLSVSFNMAGRICSKPSEIHLWSLRQQRFSLKHHPLSISPLRTLLFCMLGRVNIFFKNLYMPMSVCLSIICLPINLLICLSIHLSVYPCHFS